MTEYTNGSKVLAENECAFVGIDVHSKTWYVTILVEGCVVFKGNIAPLYNQLLRLFDRSPKQRADRDLVRTRQQLMKHAVSTKLQIKSKLLFHGIRVGGPSRWSKKYVATLRSLHYPEPSIRIAFSALLDLLEHLTSQLSELEKAINELAQTDDFKHVIDLLRTVPGIGLLTAMIIATELGDLSRFQGNEQLAAFLGLTPSECSSGEKVHRGHITHCGNPRVRKALIESSWTLIRHDAGLRRKYRALSVRIGPKRAIVAIARILSGRIRHMMLNNEAYSCAA